MTTQELKQYIDKVLGNGIRCLLPSYWWKRLFHSVADRIDEVEEKIGSTKVDIDVDSTLSSTSLNPVANSTITAELEKKQDELVSGSNIMTINGASILGSGDFEVAEAPCVVLTSDEISLQFIIQAVINNPDDSIFANLRGFVPFSNTDSDGNIISYEYCEVDVTNFNHDATTETTYGFYEFCHDGVRYRRTYNFNTNAFVGEEVISSGSVGTTTVPIVNSEEELKANYSSAEIAAAKIVETVSIRDWVRGETVVKNLLFSPTAEVVAPSSTRSFAIVNSELTHGILIVVYSTGAVLGRTTIDGVESDIFALYENGALLEDAAKQLNDVLAENECFYYNITSTTEATYALFDSFVKASIDKGLVNYVNGKVEYLGSGGSGTVDSEMSDESENAVQNKVVKAYVDSMVGDINTIIDSINGEEI